jgi:hypothetical protein
LCHGFPRLWSRLERAETALLGDRLGGVAIDRPVYVTGLARSGTTVLLELLAGLPSVATHRYRDFPPVWTPWLWNSFLELVPQPKSEPRERPHQDGIAITPESPEAMEEPIWMRHFPAAHDPSVSSLLGRDTSNPAFEAFYRRHIAKMLLVRGGTRYIAKGNYNVSRLAYIQTLFPDARFVVPIRHPVGHIASLSRQHENFAIGQRAHPAARTYLRRVGHFEFGLDRAPVNMGDSDEVQGILARWNAGDEPGGWALYWSHVYGRLLDQLERDERLRAAVLIVRHEDLVERPLQELQRVLEHCGLVAGKEVVGAMAAKLRPSGREGNSFDAEDARRILAATAGTMARYGYHSPPNG